MKRDTDRANKWNNSSIIIDSEIDRTDHSQSDTTLDNTTTDTEADQIRQSYAMPANAPSTDIIDPPSQHTRHKSRSNSQAEEFKPSTLLNQHIKPRTSRAIHQYDDQHNALSQSGTGVPYLNPCNFKTVKEYLAYNEKYKRAKMLNEGRDNERE